jgi:hypothetical protein
MAGILLAYINPLNTYFVDQYYSWILPLIYATTTLAVTVLLTQIVNEICIALYKRNTLSLGHVLVVVLIYNLVLIFGSRQLSVLLNDHIYDKEPMNYVFWTWHFYIYLISCVCYIVFLNSIQTLKPEPISLLPFFVNPDGVLAEPNDILQHDDASFQSIMLNKDTSELIPEKTKRETPFELVTIKDCSMNIHNIYFLRSYQKYIDICIEKEDQIITKIVRTTLVSAESVLSVYPFMYRCHKSYLINLNKLAKISGNTKGFFFHLENIEEPIPVSRSNNDFVLHLLEENSELKNSRDLF